MRSITPGIVLGGIVGGALAKYLDNGDIGADLRGVRVLLCAADVPQRKTQTQSAAARRSWHVRRRHSHQHFVATGWRRQGVRFMSVPFMTWCNVSIHRAVGTSSAIGLPITVVGTIAFLVNGITAAALPPGSLGFIYLPALLGVLVPGVVLAPVGARLASKLAV